VSNRTLILIGVGLAALIFFMRQRGSAAYTGPQGYPMASSPAGDYWSDVL
jgi:hypothetical protein